MPPFLKNAFDRVKSSLDSLFDRLTLGAGTPGRERETPRWLPWLAGLLVFVLVVYYPVGMAFYTTIDDNPDYQPSPKYLVEGGSRAVAIAASLVDRETEYWAPNKPLWMPAAALDNMPNYQQGMVSAIGRFALGLSDFLARVRGSSAADPDVRRAVGFLNYDGTIWYWGQGNIIPMAKSETQFRQACEALLAYNKNVAAGRATYERRADNLIEFLSRVASDLGSASASLDERAEASNAGYFDRKADDVFYDVKGRLYAYYLILRELGADFAPVIRERQAQAVWDQMLESLKAAAKMNPLVIANGDEDGMIVPSHLRTLESSLLRSRTQIKELADVFQK